MKQFHLERSLSCVRSLAWVCLWLLSVADPVSSEEAREGVAASESTAVVAAAPAAEPPNGDATPPNGELANGDAPANGNGALANGELANGDAAPPNGELANGDAPANGNGALANGELANGDAVEAAPNGEVEEVKAPEPISEEKRAAKAAADRIREAEAEASRVRRALAQVVVREKAGILLRQGYLQIEPSFSYSHSSRDRLDVAGLNIIDAVFVGVQDVEQVERNGFTSSLGIRYGIFDDLQFGMTIPFDWSTEDVFRPEDIERVPVPREVVDSNDGAGIGDMSFALSYHFFPETRFIPDLVASLGYKTKSGESPYDAGRDGIATGSGHQGLRTGISFVKASEPAIIFGSAGYFFSLPEKDIFDTRTGTEWKEIDPGDTFSYSVGLAFSLNWNLSISASLEHSIGSRTKLERVLVDGRRRRTFSFDNPRSETNAAVLRFGMTYAMGGRTSLDFNVGVGLTRDAPDVILSTSMPVTLNANEYVRRIKLPRLWRD